MDGPADDVLETVAEASSSSSSSQATSTLPHTVSADRRVLDEIIYNRLKATQVSRLH